MEPVQESNREHKDGPKLTVPSVEEIMRGSAHALTIFERKAVDAVQIFVKQGRPYLKCYATARERPAKPEEIVRQLYVKMLMDDYGYPAERIAIEKPVQFGSAVHEKAADVVVWDKDAPDTAHIIIECKKPKRSDGLEQLKSYCHAESPSGKFGFMARHLQQVA